MNPSPRHRLGLPPRSKAAMSSASDDEFPARRLSTALEWDDLVLDQAALRDLEDIVQWIRHRETLMEAWKLSRWMGPGFAALFYGPPGTGKSLSAVLLGKVTGLPVYRIDLPMVISHYIGETEKKLTRLFARAAKENAILVFDDADWAGPEPRDDRNQQFAHLLQRIEDTPVVVIVTSNLRSHLDEAFARRFQSFIHFALPGVEERLRLWRAVFAGQKTQEEIDFERLAAEHELSGGAVVAVLRYACLKTIQRSPAVIQKADILDGIRRQLPPAADSHR
jgi:SpoVK/Ycf46/Vps4 family AAA+-type ATPase